jgi:photosystem II PsbJ protein
MSGKKSNLPDGRIPDRLPDGRPAGGMAVIFVVGLFFYGSYTGVGSA